MTTEGVAASQELPAADDGRLFCYRHPGRETWISCGRCEQPICTSCAMQGPVGFRCRTCGTPAHDPLTKLTPAQLGAGIAIALAGGMVIGFIGAQIGWFSLIVAFIGGGLVADGVRRATGYKIGPVVRAATLGGLLLGAVLGYGLDIALFQLPYLAEWEAEGVALGSWLPQFLAWGVIDGLAACAGAYYRTR